MAKKLYELTDEHRAQLKPWADKWIANSLSTKQMDDDDRAAMRVAMAGMYAAAGLELVPEHRQVFCSGPVTGAIAASIAGGVWWLRENPDRHIALFGRALGEHELLASLRYACAYAVAAAMGVRPARRADTPTSAATEAATRDAIEAATRDAASAATRDATWDATSAATSAAIRDATSAATLDAIEAATRGAASAATRDATRDAIEAAIRDATEAATLDATRFLMACCTYWSSYVNGGNHWSGWAAYLSFFRHVANLDLPVYEKWRHYESAATHGGYRYMHKRFWIVCDRPTTVGRDDQSRPHCDNGPQLAWRDGFSTHYIHGVKVPAFVVERPADITVALIDAERNVEIRRIMISRYVGGVAAYIRDAGAETIDESGEGVDHIVLRSRNRKGDTPLVTLTMVNHTSEADGSAKEYTIRVPPTMKSAREAMAWSEHRSVEQYAPQFQA